MLFLMKRASCWLVWVLEIPLHLFKWLDPLSEIFSVCYSWNPPLWWIFIVNYEWCVLDVLVAIAFVLENIVIYPLFYREIFYWTGSHSFSFLLKSFPCKNLVFLFFLFLFFFFCERNLVFLIVGCYWKFLFILIIVLG